MEGMYADWGVSGDNRRLFINTGIGCMGGCQYCYLGQMGINGIVCTFNTEQLIHIAKGKFIPGREGTIISIGCYTECWKKEYRRTTLDMIQYFLKMGNRVQMATKEEVTYEEFKEIEEYIQYENQFFLFISVPTISRSKDLEPGTEDVQKRIQSLGLKNQMSINTVLYIKPVLEEITIRDIDIYKKIIENYEVPVVVGELLELNQYGNSIVGKTRMCEVINNDTEKILDGLRPLTLTFKGSTDVVRRYKRQGNTSGRELQIRVTRYNKCLEIVMPKELQSDKFADNFLQIQDELELFKGKVKVSFEKTIWIDNLPMIYLFLLLKKSKEKWKNDIEFKLSDKPSVEEMRFLQYLVDYGFWSLMEELSGKKIEIDSCIDYVKLEHGNFNASKCILPCKIIKNEFEMEGYIAAIHKNLGAHLEKEISDYERENLFFKISVFAQEAMSNVFDHAYSENENKYCSIMVRLIKRPDKGVKRCYSGCGIDNRIFDTNNFTGESLKRLAHEKNPYRNSSGIQTMGHYVQIIVADIGMGFLESMDMKKDAKKERGILNRAFEKGIRSGKRDRNTDVGGLYMLYRLLGQTGGYISVKGEYNWIQIFCGKKEETKDTLPYVHIDGTDAKKTLKGVAIVGYINYDQQEYNHAYARVLPDKLKGLFSVCDERMYKGSERVQHIDFRNGIIRNWVCENKKTEILCYVPENLSKELIVNRIAKVVGDGEEAKNRTLCIVDIPEREKYKYHMIFEKISIAVMHIILVTRNASVITYSLDNAGRRMRFDGEFCERYISSESSEGGIAKSVKALLLEVRRYDSELFWNTVIDEQKKQDVQLYIPEAVMWNMDNEEQMCGYLDFSQASFNENLKKILLYQLYRLPVIAGKSIYFQSMDRFTEDICESINSRQEILKTQKYEYKNIWLGSVYVTGTSSKNTKLESNLKEDEKFYYFRHPSANERINALLLWPSEEICKQLFEIQQSNETAYGRVGKSPFVAPGGSDYFAVKHYMDTQEAIALRPKEMYDFWQQDLYWRNRLLRFGHFDMIDHHDFIHIDLIMAVHKNQMESGKTEKYVKNSYDFLLAGIYQGVGRTKAKKIEESVQSDVQTEYQDIMSKKIQNYDIPDTSGLFVYFTDYETMEIVSELKNIFVEQVQRRIIPIAPIIKKRTASALLLSPILLENIKRKIQEIEKQSGEGTVKVTIFSASITSSRLQRELKHILYRLGADEVNSLSLLDRQRFPLGAREREYFRAFIKLDLPELGVETTCRMCMGIKNINELKKVLNMDLLQERCEEIIGIWGKVKASDNHFDIGTKPRKICMPQKIMERITSISENYMNGIINISTDAGLVLFAIERTAITLSIDFVVSCMEEDIDDSTKILLLTAHILLFGEVELAERDKYQLIIDLYDILQAQQQQDEYTALACVVLVSQDKKYKSHLHSYYKEKFKRKYFKNQDFVIANIELMRELPQEEQDKELSYWLKREGEEQFEYLYGIFLFTSAESGTRHGTILLKIKNLAKQEFQKNDFLSAYNDILFLEKAYEYLPVTYFSEPERYSNLKDNMLKQIRITKDILNEILQNNDEDNYLKVKNLSHQIENMLRAAQGINSEIFKKVGATNTEIREFLQEIAGQVSQEAGVKCLVGDITDDSGEGARWYCLLEDIKREIYYLMKDMRHGSIERNGKIEVVFQKDYMVYHFENPIKKDADIVEIERRKYLKLNRPSILSLPKLQGSTTHRDNFVFKRADTNQNMFVAELRIPYIYMENGEKR